MNLPAGITTLLFDLDGVLTQTAKVHAKAWKELFDGFLHTQPGEFHEFTPRDYDAYVDGRPRLDGVRTFLASRGITLPEGSPDDPPDSATVAGLGNRKNERVLELIREQGVEVYEGSVRFVEAARDAGLRRGVVSASANCADVLRSAGIDHLFEERVDGIVAAEQNLPGKPAPDTFLYCAKLLGAAPEQAAVFEDAQAGVASGRAGGFGLVVGVNRTDQAEALREHGADLVVDDLAELL